MAQGEVKSKKAIRREERKLARAYLKALWNAKAGYLFTGFWAFLTFTIRRFSVAISVGALVVIVILAALMMRNQAQINAYGAQAEAFDESRFLVERELEAVAETLDIQAGVFEDYSVSADRRYVNMNAQLTEVMAAIYQYGDGTEYVENKADVARYFRNSDLSAYKSFYDEAILPNGSNIIDEMGLAGILDDTILFTPSIEVPDDDIVEVYMYVQYRAGAKGSVDVTPTLFNVFRVVYNLDEMLIEDMQLDARLRHARF